MSAFFAFTTEAMKLLEEEQYLQLKTKKEKDLLKPKQSMSAFFMFTNERRAALLAESKSVWEVAKITGEEWKNITEKQKKHEKVQLTLSFSLNLSLSLSATTISYFGNLQIAKQNKEKYWKKWRLTSRGRRESLPISKKKTMRFHKQEALQLLKKKEKTDNIIKKMKENHQKKKKIAYPNKPKKPTSSFLLFRKNLLEERPGISNSTLNALISVKWKELSEEDKQTWNKKVAGAKMELEEYNKSAAMEEENNNPQQ
ncbi:hypothetical protein TEA_009266 [Camellia sinensis var. sinensis]|uniref:HMG box domain-containing protein n=1 Tax=Camellia sinensis var. sinensis TaxID=542762 RepID=A0A4S4DWP4_CAMSN|nr:hypothetical protein TEA_009266 [Camellia sinensis var. sinensis]